MYTLADLAGRLGVEYRGDGGLLIHGLATLKSARGGQLSFLANPKYQGQLRETQASAVIVAPGQVDQVPCAVLISANPYGTFAAATRLFDNAPRHPAGIHARAWVHPDATVSESAHIAANAVVEAGAIIADDVVVGPGTVVGEGVRLGARTRLYANVTLYHNVRLGCDCIVHAGSVIGADGFGFAPSKDGWKKIHQLGGVVIGDRVEIGAGTTIDRGALDDTLIGSGVIIDNQVQIAHNVSIGDNTAIAGCTAIAGSTTIGRNCTIAGAVGIVGHIHITDNVHITAMTLVTGSIDKSGSYSSGTDMLETSRWRRSAVRFGQLDAMAKRLKKLEDECKNNNNDV